MGEKHADALAFVLHTLGLEPHTGNRTIRSPLREDDEHPSFSINTETGQWMDYGTGEKGNAISLARRLGYPEGFRGKTGKQACYVYTDERGTPVFEVHRRDWVDTEGNRRKEIWMTGPGGQKGMALPTPRPLFRLPEVLCSTLPVLVVEGEKCAEEVEVAGYVLSTWSGGASSVHRTDWTPLRGREVVIWPDADDAGLKAARTIQGYLPQAKILRVEGKPRGWDCWDAAQEGMNLEEFVRSCPREDSCSPSAPVPSVPNGREDATSGIDPYREEEEALKRAVETLSEFAFERSLPELSKRFGVSKAWIRKYREQLRREQKSDGQGREVQFENLEPGTEPVNGVELLEDLVQLARRYLVLPEGAAEVMALWILYSWCFEAFPISPYLAFRAPEKGSGKSTGVIFVRRLVRSPVVASNATPAALFRLIELAKPTLLLDEAETYIRFENHELRGILNSGFTRGGDEVLRTVEVGGKLEVRRFSTFCPKCFAFNGSLPSTILDRTIVVSMKRKLRKERVRPLWEGEDEEVFRALRKRIVTWVFQNQEALARYKPVLPDALWNREAQRWRPLFSIAQHVGGHWPATVERIALGWNQPEEEDFSIVLLRDIQQIFQDLGRERISTQELVERLKGIETSPWATMGSKGLTAAELAKRLRQFGILPRQMKFQGENRKGYEYQMFEDSFQRYVDSERPTQEPASEPRLHQEEVLPVEGTESSLYPGSTSEHSFPKKAVDGSGRGVESENPTLDRETVEEERSAELEAWKEEARDTLEQMGRVIQLSENVKVYEVVL